MGKTLELLPGELAVVRLEAECEIPTWARTSPFFSVSGTGTELSVICRWESVPPELAAQAPYRALAVQGPLPFSLVGLLARLTQAVAGRGISLLAVSTYETDVLLVRSQDLAATRAALTGAGFTIRGS